MHRKLMAIALPLALVACGEPAADVDERIPFGRGGLLEVDVEMGEGLRLDPGSLEVLSHDAEEVWVLADASGWGASGVQFRLDHTKEAVRLYGRIKGAFAWLFGGPHVRVRVWVPREFSVDLRVSSGPITIEEIQGSVRARTRGGSIDLVGGEGEAKLRATGGGVRVSEVLGDVDVKVSDGPIEVAWVAGRVDARTDSGDVSVKHVDGSVVVRTDSGSIELTDVGGAIDAKTERGAVYASFVGEPEGLIETGGGSLDVVIPESSGNELEARSAHGGVVLSPGLTLQGVQEEDRAVGRLNGGGPPLRLYTGRGTVRVSAR